MELNKIFAAILLAGIIGMSTGIISDMLVAPEELEENAYRVETGTAEASTAPAEEEAPGIEPIAPLLASADPAAGQALSRACAACHDFTKGGPNKVGPNNWGVVGAPMGHAEGFNYSAAMKAKSEEGAVWDYEALNQFLAAPKEFLPGTSMSYAGLKKPEDRANLIAWLRTLSDNPAPLP